MQARGPAHFNLNGPYHSGMTPYQIEIDLTSKASCTGATAVTARQRMATHTIHPLHPL